MLRQRVESGGPLSAALYCVENVSPSRWVDERADQMDPVTQAVSSQRSFQSRLPPSKQATGLFSPNFCATENTL